MLEFVEEVNQMEPRKQSRQNKQSNALAVIAMLTMLFAGSSGVSFLLSEIAAGNYNYSDQYRAQLAQAQSEAQQSAMVQAAPQTPRTFRWETRHKLCALYELDCKAKPMEADSSVELQLQTFTLGEVVEVYPLPEWSVQQDDDTNTVTICHNLDGLCEKHRAIYHLGSNETGQYVAVYYGPNAVGTSAGAFLVTDVQLSRLSPEQLSDLNDGEYEYRNRDDLIAMLDNMSEL